MYLLQINFRVSISRDAYEEEAAPVAQMIAEVPGLIWKAWGYNEEAGTAAGLYLFENEDALDCYLRSDIIKGLKRSPAFSEITVNRFELQPELSRMTRLIPGREEPVPEHVAAEES